MSKTVKLVRKRNQLAGIKLFLAGLLCAIPSRKQWEKAVSGRVTKRKHPRPNEANVKVMSLLLSNDNSNFKPRTGFNYSVFKEQICDEITSKCYHKLSSGRRARCLSFELRIFRWLLYMRGESPHSLADAFNTSLTETYKDIKRISLAVSDLSDDSLKWIDVHSDEYTTYRGAANFSGFSNVVYAGDGVHVHIRRPTKRGVERIYYSGKKKHHSVLFMVFCDGSGLIRCVNGPAHGTASEVDFYRQCVSPNIESVLRPNDAIVYDGILKGVFKHHVITPHEAMKGRTRKNELTQEQRDQDKAQRKARVIIEHVFARLKQLFPRLRHYTLKLARVGKFFRASAWLTNIHMKYEAPLRTIIRDCKGKCELCANFGFDSI